MSPASRNFEQFSRDLDTEWLRDRVRVSLAATAAPTESEDTLATAIGRADPLAEEPSRGGWLAGILEGLGTWPGRLSFAGATAALLLVGIGLGRILPRSAPPVVATAIPRPTYEPESTRGLGAAASVKPESERKFQDAMALLQAPDFVARALPMLRESVAEDATNDRAQFWLGVLLLLKGRASDSIEPLEEAARLAPGNTRYRQYLMVAYLQTGATDKALALQTELLKKP